jgi:SOS-response transcriptional repressor LexA
MKQTWIVDRLEELGRTQAELARFMSMPPPRISEIVSGRRKIQINEFPRLIEFLGISGADAMAKISSSGAQHVPAYPEESITPKAPGFALVNFRGESYTPVPVYDIRTPAGSAALSNGSAPLHHHLFTTQSLRNFTDAPPELLAVTQVSGDGMEPTLRQGDDILIDRRQTRIGTDGIYAYTQADGGELLVKRFQRSAKSKFITIRSDNPRYDIETGISDDDISVIGRVIWIGRHIGG